MTRVSTHAWFNGEIVQRESGAPSIASISFHLGTGVFDGLMAYWNADHYYCHRAEEHLVRFRDGAQRMGMKLPWSIEQLRQGIDDLLATEPAATQYVRPIVYRRAPELWITGSEGQPVDVSIFTVKVDREIGTALTCHISPVERISGLAIPPQTKVSGAYVNSFNARKSAELAGFQDGLMLDRQGRIAEASAANFFAVIGDRLLTPTLNMDVFPGITRKVILELAAGSGIEWQESELLAQDVRSLDGAFLCSTLMELRPLSCIGSHLLRTTELPAYLKLAQTFSNLTRQ